MILKCFLLLGLFSLGLSSSISRQNGKETEQQISSFRSQNFMGKIIGLSFLVNGKGFSDLKNLNNSFFPFCVPTFGRIRTTEMSFFFSLGATDELDLLLRELKNTLSERDSKFWKQKHFSRWNLWKVYSAFFGKQISCWRKTKEFAIVVLYFWFASN